MSFIRNIFKRDTLSRNESAALIKPSSADSETLSSAIQRLEPEYTYILPNVDDMQSPAQRALLSEQQQLDSARLKLAKVSKAIERLEGIVDVSNFLAPSGTSKNRNLPLTKLGAALAVMTIVEAFRCVDIRRQRLGSLKWEIRRISDDSLLEDSKEQYPSHALAVAIQRSARAFNQNLFGKWEYFKCMAGETYIEIVPDIWGRDAGLKILSSLATDPYAPQGEIVAYQYQSINGTIMLPKESVVMDRYLHPLSEIQGRAPMEVAIGIGNIIRNMERQINAHYVNNGAVGLTVSPKNTEDKLDDLEVKAVAKLIREQIEGTDNTSSTLVSPIPADIVQHEMSDISKNVALTDSMLARIFTVFGIARSLAGDFDDTKYKAAEETEDVVNRVTIIPEADEIAALVNNEIMPRFDSSGDYYFAFNYDIFNRLSSDKTKRIAAAAQYFSAGLGSRNESREIAQEPALQDERGEEFFSAAALPAAETNANLPAVVPSQSDAAIAQLLDKVNEIQQLTRLSSRSFDINSQKTAALKEQDFSQSIIVALFLTEGIEQELSAASTALASPVERGSMHITLGYIGKTSDDIDLSLLTQTIKEIAPELPQARAIIKGLGRMVKREEDNAIYARIEGYELESLYNQLSYKLIEKAGIILSKYTSFIPHITLGYIAPDELTPEIALREQELVFDAISVAVGAARYHYPLGQRERPQDKDDAADNATDENETTAGDSATDATTATVDTEREQLEQKLLKSLDSLVLADLEQLIAEREQDKKAHKHEHKSAADYHRCEHVTLSEQVKAQINELDTWRRSARKTMSVSKAMTFACRDVPAEIAESLKSQIQAAAESIETLAHAEDTRRELLDSYFKSAEIDCRIVDSYPAWFSKSVASYRNRMREFGRGFWSGLMDSRRFIDGVQSAVETEYSSAFRQGLAREGITWEDLSDSEREILDAKIVEEQQYIAGLAQYIDENSRANKGKLASVLSRVELWASRYDGIFDLGVLVGAKDKKKMWKYDESKEHCVDCLRLNGLVYRASTWLRYGIIPRSALLACFGIFCGCSFVDTDEPVRKGRPPTLVGRRGSRRRKR